MRPHEIACSLFVKLQDIEDLQRGFSYKTEWFGGDAVLLHVTDTMKNTTETFALFVGSKV
jgi:hypothetical protein